MLDARERSTLHQNPSLKDYTAAVLPSHGDGKIPRLIMMNSSSQFLVSTRGEEDINIAKLFMDHQSQQSHHGSTALVQLDCALLQFGLFLYMLVEKVNNHVRIKVRNAFGNRSAIACLPLDLRRSCPSQSPKLRCCFKTRRIMNGHARREQEGKGG